MAGETQDAAWPLPKFYFSVDIPGLGKDLPFQEVSGLETETQVIEYRGSSGKTWSALKMPGLAKIGNVTMKKGIFPNSSDFWSWYRQIKMNTLERQTITIKLLDEAGEPKMIWTLTNAWPTKVTSTDLKSSGEQVAIDTIELAFEKLTVEAP